MNSRAKEKLVLVIVQAVAATVVMAEMALIIVEPLAAAVVAAMVQTVGLVKKDMFPAIQLKHMRLAVAVAAMAEKAEMQSRFLNQLIPIPAFATAAVVAVTA